MNKPVKKVNNKSKFRKWKCKRKSENNKLKDLEYKFKIKRKTFKTHKTNKNKRSKKSITSKRNY